MNDHIDKFTFLIIIKRGLFSYSDGNFGEPSHK